MKPTASPPGLQAPPLRLFAFEGVRATLEYARMRLMDRAVWTRGDGHAVILFPGLAAGPATTGPLRQFCRDLGLRGPRLGPRPQHRPARRRVAVARRTG